MFSSTSSSGLFGSTGTGDFGLGSARSPFGSSKSLFGNSSSPFVQNSKSGNATPESTTKNTGLGFNFGLSRSPSQSSTNNQNPDLSASTNNQTNFRTPLSQPQQQKVEDLRSHEENLNADEDGRETVGLGLAKSGQSLFMLSQSKHYDDDSTLHDGENFPISNLRCCKASHCTMSVNAENNNVIGKELEVNFNDIPCWPCLPTFGQLIAFEFNDKGSMLLIASAYRVAIVRLHPLHDPYDKATQASTSKNSALVVGTIVWEENKNLGKPQRLKLEGTWRIAGSVGRHFPQEHIVFDGEIVVDERENLVRYHGRLTGTRTGSFSMTTTNAAYKGSFKDHLAQGVIWQGRGKFDVAGSSPTLLPITMTIVSSTETCSSTGVRTQTIQCSLGHAQVSLVQDRVFNTHISSVEHAAWYPQSKSGGHLVVLTSEGQLLMYDAERPDSELEEPLHVVNVNVELDGDEYISEEQVNRSFKSFAFGLPAAGHDERKALHTLWRRLTLYLLREDGAVVALCPYVGPGVDILSQYETENIINLLESSVNNGTEIEKDETKHIIEWIKGQTAYKDKVLRVQVLNHNDCSPEERLQSSWERQASSDGYDKATTFAVLPIRDTPCVSIIRVWKSGIIDVLTGGSAIEPCWIDNLSVDQNEPTPGSNSPAKHVLSMISSSEEDEKVTRHLGEKLRSAIIRRNMYMTDICTNGVSREQKYDDFCYVNYQVPYYHDYPMSIVHSMRLWNEENGITKIFGDVVYPDVCVCVGCHATGTVKLLYLPFLEKLRKALKGEPAAVESLMNNMNEEDDIHESEEVVEDNEWVSFARPLTSSRRTPFGKNLLNFVCVSADQEIGHNVFSVGGSKASPNVICLEITDACVNIRSSTVTPSVLQDCSTIEEKETQLIVDDTAYKLQKLMGTFLTIPKQLQGIYFGNGSAPPALEIAGVEWLNQTFTGLTYGGNGSGNTSPSDKNNIQVGLLCAIQAGLEALEKRRYEQDEEFDRQAKALAKIKEDIVVIYEEGDILKNKCERLIELQLATAEALDESSSICRSLRPSLTRAERRFHGKVDKMFQKVADFRKTLGTDEGLSQLEKLPMGKLSGLKARVANLLSTEKEQFRQVNFNISRGDTKSKIPGEIYAAIKELEKSTSSLLSKLTDTSINGQDTKLDEKQQNEKMQTFSFSLPQLRERLDDIQAYISSLSSLPSSVLDENMLVTLVAISCPETLAIRQVLLEEMSTSNFSQKRTPLFIDRALLGRGYQALLRRQLGLHAVDYPFYIDISSKENIREKRFLGIIMLDKLAKIEKRFHDDAGKRIVITMSDDLNKVNIRDLVRVTLLRPKSKFDDLIQVEGAPIDYCLDQVSDLDKTNRTGIAIIDDGDMGREALDDTFKDLRQLEKSITAGLDAEIVFRHVF